MLEPNRTANGRLIGIVRLAPRVHTVENLGGVQCIPG